MQSLAPLNSLLFTIVLATLAIGLPIFFVLAIRFFWERKLGLGRSKDLEKLIWQLHRIASALEHQMNLAFPAVQPGTEEPRDLVYLQQPTSQPQPATRSVAPANSAVPQPIADQVQQAGTSTSAPPLANPQPGTNTTRHGVNSMFGL